MLRFELRSAVKELEFTFEVQRAPNKVLQRTRLNFGDFPWRSVRAAELGRYAFNERSGR